MVLARYNYHMQHGTHNFLLWENLDFRIYTPKNPHLPYSEGLQLVIESNRDLTTAWEDPSCTGKAFELAAQICQIVQTQGLAPWFNIQANGNWGLLEGATSHFHVHIYGRNKNSERWGKPIILPELPKTYFNEPMPEPDQELLIRAFRKSLS